MKWDTETFCNKWLDGTLKRKKQHGSYYIQTFENAEFLCYHCGGSQNFGSLPAVIAMKCPKSGIMLMDEHNFLYAMPGRIGHYHRKKAEKSAVYVVNFGELDRKTSDLAEIKEVEHKVVFRDNNEEAMIVLFDINGTKYYTDIKSGSVCKSREEYLNLHDLKGIKGGLDMTLVAVPQGCNSIADARAHSIPTLVGDGDFKVFNESFFVPAPDFDDIIPPKVLQTARWRPNGFGWGLPQYMLRETGQLSWEWDRVQGTASFMKKVNKDITDSEEIANCQRYHNMYMKWWDAHRYITKRLVSDHHRHRHTFEFQAENALMENNLLYVKGLIREEDDADTKKMLLTLGDTWHVVLKKGEFK